MIQHRLQVPAPVVQVNTAAIPPAAVEEEPKEDGEEFEDLATMLEHLGLSEYKTTFDQERIDVESFVRKIKAATFISFPLMLKSSVCTFLRNYAIGRSPGFLLRPLSSKHL